MIYVSMHWMCLYQEMIDNSYASNIDWCEIGIIIGSPNPYMDSPDNWGWIGYDGAGYPMPVIAMDL